MITELENIEFNILKIFIINPLKVINTYKKF